MSRKTLIATSALGLAGLIAVAVPSLGRDDPKQADGPNLAKVAADKPKPDAKAKAVASLRMTADLVTYGRESKSPEALILAAKLLAATPAKENAGSAKQTEGTPKSEKVEIETITPESLLAEAKTMSDAEFVVAMIADARKIILERSKGEIDGPACHNGYLGPNGVGTWTAVFRANELASVTIAGCGGADFDLYVIDDRGNPIRQDTGPTANASCTWYPAYTASYTFRVVNCSPFASGYRFINN